MRYEIPAENYVFLVKKINRIKKKCDGIVLKSIRVFYKKLENTDEYIKMLEIEASGKYVINDWQFVAVIEHKKGGNVIRCIVPKLEDKIPKNYFTCRPYCEHCNTLRDRKDTYLIYSETEGFKQVGKSCLMEYTSGLSAERCASFATVLRMCEDACKFNDEKSTSSKYFDCNLIKKYAYGIVSKYGYVKKEEQYSSTWYKIHQILDSNVNFNISCITLPSDENIKEIQDYLESVKTITTYISNVRTLWYSDYVESRDFALIASFISIALKEIKNAKLEILNQQETHYVGSVKERITIKVKSMRCVASYRSSYSHYSDYESFIYEIIDTDNNHYKWSASYDIKADSVTEITGTIKAHQEYKGIKQTVITGCKVC